MRTKQKIQQTRFGNHIPTTDFKVSDVTVMAPIRQGVVVIAGKPACFGDTQHIAVGLHFQGKKVLKLLSAFWRYPDLPILVRSAFWACRLCSSSPSNTRSVPRIFPVGIALNLPPHHSLHHGALCVLGFQVGGMLGEGAHDFLVKLQALVGGAHAGNIHHIIRYLAKHAALGV